MKRLPGRVLAVDWGGRRIGLAVSDELGLTIRGLPTLERTNRKADFEHLRATIEREEIAVVVVGHPLNMDGSESESSRQARKLARTLAQTCAVAVELVDERLSSAEAAGVLRSRGEDPRREKGRLDRAAAEILLRDYLGQHADRQQN